ncbi:MAG: phosphoribosyl-AMP cyclohydrolase [Caldimicrobium sp.]
MDYKLNFEKGHGLIPAIIQDIETGKVLMLGFMNKEALNKTLSSGKVHFYSRSKQRLWMKGETSGHVLLVKEIYIDCDGDTLLIKVKPEGPVCHEGYSSCFYRKILNTGEVEITERRIIDPEAVYEKKT